MSQWSEGIRKAEHLAEEHPEQAQEALRKGGQFAEERTDHRFDREIDAAGRQIGRRFGDAGDAGDAGQDTNSEANQDSGMQEDPNAQRERSGQQP